jgi:hypothetical protein
MENVEHIITGYIIPAIAIFMSYMFWLHGRDSAKKAEQLLDEITRTSRGWQKDIMESANQMLNARPELAAHQMYMSKIAAVSKLSDAITNITEDITKNPKTGQEGADQLANLKMLLDYQIHYFNIIIDNKPMPQTQNTVKTQPANSEAKPDEKQQPVK